MENDQQIRYNNSKQSARICMPDMNTVIKLNSIIYFIRISRLQELKKGPLSFLLLLYSSHLNIYLQSWSFQRQLIKLLIRLCDFFYMKCY